MNTTESIIETLMDLGGIDRAAAEHVSKLYLNAGIIKIRLHSVGWTVTHGAYLDRDQIQHAATL